MVHVHFIKINATWIICNTLRAFSHICYRFIIIHNRIFKLFRKSCLFFGKYYFFSVTKDSAIKKQWSNIWSSLKIYISPILSSYRIFSGDIHKIFPTPQMTTYYITSNHYYTMCYYCIRTHPLWPPLPWWWTDAAGTVCWPPSHFWFAPGWRVRSPDLLPHLLSTVS